MKPLLGAPHSNQIILFDPGRASLNIGDEIISESARRYVTQLFPECFYATVSTHQKISFRYRRNLNKSKLAFVLGSNLLKGKMLLGYRQWDISLLDTFQVDNCVLVGCGWISYNSRVDAYSSALYKRLLSQEFIHSVRDEYTLCKLKELGIKNAVNTGCPTLWSLNEEHCASIPQKKSDSVVMTITDYRKDPKRDAEMFDILEKKYKTIYLWIQGSGDFDYARELGVLDRFTIVSADLAQYDYLLETEDVDYVGTRLHGGIRALQKGKRTIIVSVDNRAREMGSNFGLKTIERENISDLSNVVDSSFQTRIRLNQQSISAFLGQFK